MSDNRLTALVTGASSGIGRSYALELAKQGTHDLLLVARRQERLLELKQNIEEQLPGGTLGERLRIEIFQADLTDTVQLTALLSHMENCNMDIDVLVNAAGFGTIGEFAKLDFEREVSMIALNCLAPLQLIRDLVGPMEQRGQGTIINISSIGAFQPAPYMAAYAASKAFLLNFTLALSEEVGEKGIRVMAHCPGPTSTEFHLVAGLPEDMSPIPAMSPEAAVQEALRALNRNKRLIVNGLPNRWLVRLGRLVSLERSARVAKKMLLSRWNPTD